MRILLSTIGSRGDVQPLLALASALRTRGQEVRFCVPPDFCEVVEGLGFHATPIGPTLRNHPAATPLATPTPEARRRMARDTVVQQFAVVGAAAEGCELLLGANALQIAARSIAERLRIPYVFTAYCPATLPSDHHPPPPTATLRAAASSQTASAADNRALWRSSAEQLNQLFGGALNEQRRAIGLSPVSDVQSHILSDRPWLAADPTLGPWPGGEGLDVVQTGAWILPDQRPLPAELAAFLEDGEAPVYFGFGSMRIQQEVGQIAVRAARALGRRAVVQRGWADLSAADGPDCLFIGEVNQQALFERVAAVVHHGGAGTTTAAAAAGRPQVIVPQSYDQPYWARRVQALGIGAALEPGNPSTEALVEALNRALAPDSAARARDLVVRIDGASLAAARLLDL